LFKPTGTPPNFTELILQELTQFIRTAFASSVNLDENNIFGPDLSLAQVMAQSESLHNSVDLMEAFAKVANQVKRRYGIKVRLPAFPLETKISEVLAVFVAEIGHCRVADEAPAPAAAPSDAIQEAA
jgi:hypothetical protein